MNRRGAVLQHILALDPERDHQEIVTLDCRDEFPFDITRSLDRRWGFPRPPRGLAALLNTAMRTPRAAVLRYLPPRKAAA